MKNLLLFASILLSSIASTYAQDDPKSKAVIDKLIAKSKAWTSFEADFVSVLVNNASKLNVKQEGNVRVKGKLFHLALTDNTVINDGKAIYTYSKKSNEVTISDPADTVRPRASSSIASSSPGRPAGNALVTPSTTRAGRCTRSACSRRSTRDLPTSW